MSLHDATCAKENETLQVQLLKKITLMKASVSKSCGFLCDIQYEVEIHIEKAITIEQRLVTVQEKDVLITEFYIILTAQ